MGIYHQLHRLLWSWCIILGERSNHRVFSTFGFHPSKKNWNSLVFSLVLLSLYSSETNMFFSSFPQKNRAEIPLMNEFIMMVTTTTLTTRTRTARTRTRTRARTATRIATTTATATATTTATTTTTTTPPTKDWYEACLKLANYRYEWQIMNLFSAWGPTLLVMVRRSGRVCLHMLLVGHMVRSEKGLDSQAKNSSWHVHSKLILAVWYTFLILIDIDVAMFEAWGQSVHHGNWWYM